MFFLQIFRVLGEITEKLNDVYAVTCMKRYLIDATYTPNSKPHPVDLTFLTYRCTTAC